MIIRTDGCREPGWIDFQRLRILRILAPLSSILARLEVRDGKVIEFAVRNYRELYRVCTLLSKEPGTVQWLNQQLRPDDVFFDIGANIGIYSLYAATLGRGVKVFAFEPHGINFASLLCNIQKNGLCEEITPSSIAIHDESGVYPFHYNQLEAGSTASQVNQMHYDDKPFDPLMSEHKACASLDGLMEQAAFPAPTLIKIDVDGNELKILRGMRRLLTSDARPRSIQIELNLEFRQELLDFLESAGYRVSARHFTLDGQRRLDAGESASKIPHNIICEPEP